MSDSEKYDRSIRLFGADGQKKIRATTATVIGVGGLGSALCQHLAMLGVKQIFAIEDEQLQESNRNRFIGARVTDPIPGTHKLNVVERLVHETNRDVKFISIYGNLLTPEAFAAIRNSDWTFGCLDEDGPRAILTEICAAYAKPLIDLATDVPEPGVYGGRVCVSNGDGCLFCLDQLNQRDVRRFLSTDEELEREAQIYGIPVSALGGTGPAVAPINGVVASLAATEFMAAVVGLRPSNRLIIYRGDLSKVFVCRDEPAADCYYCKGIRGAGDSVDVERYLKMTHILERRRK